MQPIRSSTVLDKPNQQATRLAYTSHKFLERNSGGNGRPSGTSLSSQRRQAHCAMLFPSLNAVCWKDNGGVLRKTPAQKVDIHHTNRCHTSDGELCGILKLPNDRTYHHRGDGLLVAKLLPRKINHPSKCPKYYHPPSKCAWQFSSSAMTNDQTMTTWSDRLRLKIHRERADGLSPNGYGHKISLCVAHGRNGLSCVLDRGRNKI